MPLPNCTFAAPTVERVRGREQCNCAPLTSSSSVDAVKFGASLGARSRRSRRRQPRWGLPTAACPAPRYLTHDYPRLHRERLRRGDVLYHCSNTGALGDYPRSIPEALVLSIVLDRAFLLQCDITNRDEGVKITWPTAIAAYFFGAHFDWRLPPMPAGLVHNSSNVTALDAVNTVPRYRDLNLTEFRQQTVGALRVHSAGRSWTAWRVLARSPDVAERFGALANLPPLRLNGCLLRYLFKPTKHLSNLLVQAFPSASVRVIAGGGLLPSAAMHIRVGDSVWSRHSPFASTGRAGLPRGLDRPWRWSLETRDSLFSRYPLRAMQCLMRASRVRPETEPGGTAAPASSAIHTCLSCIVVGDATELIEECARRALVSPILTNHVAMHPVVAGRYGFDAHRRLSNEKSVVDWYLLARSHTVVTFGLSAFAGTALWFRNAGAVAGRHIAIHNVTRVLQRTDGEDEWDVQACGRQADMQQW